MPDLSRRILKLNALAHRAGRWGLVRVLLAAVATELLVLSVPALVWGQRLASSEHGARHVGAFTAAYGAGLLLVALRPARARTLLPVAATLALAVLITAVVDVIDGRAPLWDETLHLPEVVSVVLVWLLAVPSRSFPGRGGTEGGEVRSELRVVDPPDDPEAGTRAV
jgi:hypothetical protein